LRPLRLCGKLFFKPKSQNTFLSPRRPSAEITLLQSIGFSNKLPDSEFGENPPTKLAGTVPARDPAKTASRNYFLFIKQALG
jgi:hypothetical protein